MATPTDRDNTLLDIRAAADDAGSKGALTHCCCCCASRLPNPHKHCDCLVSHQVETDIPRIKQETNPQSSLVKPNIPVTTQTIVLPLTNATDTGTTHVKEKTPSIQSFDDEEIFFQTLSVSNASKLLFLPPKLQNLRIKDYESLDVLPDDFLDGLPNLKGLEFMNCSNLRSFPYPASLTDLYISKCRKF
ncbi:putative leucine-rich repeat domain, L domain-containing protein [Medicago truncatula]|uniref:Putative leucine-rich repeat domain, L domain-containing protein n=1 Tax=Medicago truncatula TaxID=3880 RepID=A0A396IZ65_MEDTR|nr:putative leucine-rich repeat domain, L domain-containing protein [Medicago truncatula]